MKRRQFVKGCVPVATIGIAGCTGGGDSGTQSGGSSNDESGGETELQSESSSWQDVFDVKSLEFVSDVKGDYWYGFAQVAMENTSNQEISHATVHVAFYNNGDKTDMLQVKKPEFYNWSPGQVAEFEVQSGPGEKIGGSPHSAEIVTVEYSP